MVGGSLTFQTNPHGDRSWGSEVILPKTDHKSPFKGSQYVTAFWKATTSKQVLQSSSVIFSLPLFYIQIMAIPSPKNTCAGTGCCRGWRLLEVSCSRRSYLSPRAKDAALSSAWQIYDHWILSQLMPSQQTLCKVEAKWVVFVLHHAIPWLRNFQSALCQSIVLQETSVPLSIHRIPKSGNCGLCQDFQELPRIPPWFAGFQLIRLSICGIAISLDAIAKLEEAFTFEEHWCLLQDLIVIDLDCPDTILGSKDIGSGMVRHFPQP